MARGAKFGTETARRVIRQTRRGEAEKVNLAPNPRAMRQMLPAPDVFWAFVLTENLEAGDEADAYKLEWRPEDNGNEGEYEETTTDMVVRDTLSRSWGIIGEKGIARLLYNADPTTNAMVWEVFINPGAPWYEGTLDEQLDYDSTADATVVIDGTNQTITVHDRFLSSGEHLDSAARVGIVYDLENTRFVVTETAC